MEEPTNQDQSELFKNIAIATVVSINDVNVNKEKPIIIPENKSIIDDIAVAIAVSAASQSTSSDKPPEVVPVEDQSVVVATAVSAVNQNEDAVELLIYRNQFITLKRQLQLLWLEVLKVNKSTR